MIKQESVRDKIIERKFIYIEMLISVLCKYIYTQKIDLDIHIHMCMHWFIHR